LSHPEPTGKIQITLSHKDRDHFKKKISIAVSFEEYRYSDQQGKNKDAFISIFVDFDTDDT
jgi:hypothetical protein